MAFPENFAGIQKYHYRRSTPMNRVRSILWEEHRLKAVQQEFRPFRGAQVLQYLHRANNAPLDKNAINLAEIPVFERCFKYGTSPDYIPKKIKETPEMIVSVKLYA